MAFEAKLDIGGSKYDVLECEYEFSQSIDQAGKPSTRPRGGLLNLILKSTGDSDMLFQEWMFKDIEAKSGSIEFVISGEGEKREKKVVHFEDAFCVNFYEYFNHNNSILMYMKITLSAAVIRFGDNGAKFKNDWALGLSDLLSFL